MKVDAELEAKPKSGLSSLESDADQKSANDQERIMAIEARLKDADFKQRKADYELQSAKETLAEYDHERNQLGAERAALEVQRQVRVTLMNIARTT